MSKNIVIIGGGISGLSLLHYLRIKHYFNKEVSIILFEKEEFPGGTIQTEQDHTTVFEFGPNGFLNQSEKTFSLIEDLELTDELIKASPLSKKRYVCEGNKIYPIPTSPMEIFKFPLLNFVAKCRIFLELFIPKGQNKTESVYGFMARRFGKSFADLFAHCIVSGIYAGDAKQLSLKHAFPKMNKLEEEYGSIIRGAIKKKKENKNEFSGKDLFSLKTGMQVVINALARKYKNVIYSDHEVKTISHDGEMFIVYTKAKQYYADEIYLTAPAYAAANMLKGLSEQLSMYLKQFCYAPVAVVGLLYEKKDFKNLLDGFGYLNSSKDQKDVLGILFESQIFEHRCRDHQVFLRAMVGGVCNSHIIDLSDKEIIDLVKSEIEKTLAPSNGPIQSFIKFWPKAIAQYDLEHGKKCEEINACLKDYPGLYLTGNYLSGVSFNDCIKNSYELAQISTSE